MMMRKMFSVWGVFCLLLVMVSCNQQSGTPVEQENDTIVLQGAEADLTQKIMADSSDADLFYQRAKYYLSQAQLEAAHKDVQKAISLDTANVDYFYLLGDVNFAKGNIANAKVAFEKCISMDEKHREANLKLAELFYLLRDYKKVGELTDQLLLWDKNNALAYYIRARASKEMGDTLKAIQYFQKTVYLEPEHYEGFIELGLLFAEKHDPVALQYYKNALEVMPNSPEALYNIGVFYQEHKQAKQAAEAYNLAINVKEPGKYAPFVEMALYNMGLLYYNDFKEYNKAAQYFTDAINRAPDYVEAIYMRGVCLEELGDFSNARMDYKKALQLKENYQKALDGLNRLDEKTIAN